MIQIDNICKILNLKQVGKSYCGQYLSYCFELKQIDMNIVVLSTYGNNAFSFEKMKKILLEKPPVDNVEILESILSVEINTGILDNNGMLLLIDEIVGIYTDFGVVSICKLCEINLANDYYRYSGEPMPLCSECVTKAHNIKKEAESASLYSCVAGSLGALVGALLGSIGWIVLGMIGFYASIAGTVISYASLKLYTKFGGNQNKAAIIIIGLSVLIAVVVAELTGIGIQIAKMAKADGIQFRMALLVQTLIMILTTKEGFVKLLPNLLMGLAFAFLGSWRLFKSVLKKEKSENIVIEQI